MTHARGGCRGAMNVGVPASGAGTNLQALLDRVHARQLDPLTATREIAERVHLSENMVKSHIQEIFRKLGVRNRVEAALRATKEGWTDGSP